MYLLPLAGCSDAQKPTVPQAMQRWNGTGTMLHLVPKHGSAEMTQHRRRRLMRGWVRAAVLCWWVRMNTANIIKKHVASVGQQQVTCH